jgi:hypothetical protein
VVHEEEDEEVAELAVTEAEESITGIFKENV